MADYDDIWLVYEDDKHNHNRRNCDCDFHMGMWLDPVDKAPHFVEYMHIKLKYAKDGDPVPPDGYCNHPSRNRLSPTISAAMDAKAAFESKFAPKLVKMSAAPVGGMTCERCGIRNEYAGSNRPGGKYMCYACRP